MRDPVVLVIGSEVGSSGMAAGFRTHRVIRALRATGCRVVILNLTGRRPGGHPPVPDLINLRCHDGAEPRASRFLRRLLSPDYPHAGVISDALSALKDAGVNPDVIYCGTPPHSMQRVAAGISAALRIPYLADLRDDWAGNHRQRFLTPLHRWHARRMEAAAVATASTVILNTPVVRARFDAAYPDQAGKFLTVTNGYDSSLDAWSGVRPAPGRFVIAYAGSPYWGFMEEKIARLHEGLMRTGLHERFQVETMGEGWSFGAGTEPLARWTHHGGLDDDSMARILSGANLLLLAMPPGEREPSPTVPLKTYGYLRLGKSIVYLGERGATTDLLGQFEGTWWMDRGQWDQLPRWIEANEQKLSVTWPRPGSEMYNMDTLARRIVDRLLELAGTRTCT